MTHTYKDITMFKPTRTKQELLAAEGVVVTYYGELAIIFLQEDLAKLSADEYRMIRTKAAYIYYRGVAWLTSLMKVSHALQSSIVHKGQKLFGSLSKV